VPALQHFALYAPGGEARRPLVSRVSIYSYFEIDCRNLLGLSMIKISRGRPTFMKSKNVSSGIGALKRVKPFV